MAFEFFLAFASFQFRQDVFECGLSAGDEPQQAEGVLADAAAGGSRLPHSTVPPAGLAAPGGAPLPSHGLPRQELVDGGPTNAAGETFRQVLAREAAEHRAGLRRKKNKGAAAAAAAAAAESVEGDISAGAAMEGGEEEEAERPAFDELGYPEEREEGEGEGEGEGPLENFGGEGEEVLWEDTCGGRLALSLAPRVTCAACGTSALPPSLSKLLPPVRKYPQH